MIISVLAISLGFKPYCSTVAGVILLFTSPWYWGIAAIVAGYVLQWAGHRVEGNDVGEWAGIKRLLGLPYVGISPRWEQHAQD